MCSTIKYNPRGDISYLFEQKTEEERFELFCEVLTFKDLWCQQWFCVKKVMPWRPWRTHTPDESDYAIILKYLIALHCQGYYYVTSF